VTLQMLDHTSSEALRLLGEGAIDMGVDARFDLPDGCAAAPCSSRSSSRWRARIIRSSPRPASSRASRIPPEIYCAIPQVLMSMDGGRTGTVDRVLAAAD
jgi:hypothetical protein